jgi:membrane fusion protein, multidrug efflux system
MRPRTDEYPISSVNIRQSTAVLPLLLLSLALSLSGCGEEGQANTEATARPVKVAVVEPSLVQRSLSFSGVVRPRIESALGFRVAGKVVERRVNVGDRVEMGQIIARLDDTDLKLTENSTRAAVLAARTRRDVAATDLDRARKLLPQSFISQSAYDLRKNELDAATAALDMAEAQLKEATNAVGYATLAADKAGIVTAVDAEPGQVLAIGQPVINMAEAGDTEIAIAVPEQDYGRLRVGEPATAKLWTDASIEARGRIREIAGQADPASRTYAVRIAVTSPPSAMRLGMTAAVTIDVGNERSQITVPISALSEHDGNPAVYVVDRATKVVRERRVSLDGVAANGARVTSGLTAGDMVVIAGVQFLREGMPIKVSAQQ